MAQVAYYWGVADWGTGPEVYIADWDAMHDIGARVILSCHCTTLTGTRGWTQASREADRIAEEQHIQSTRLMGESVIGHE